MRKIGVVFLVMTSLSLLSMYALEWTSSNGYFVLRQVEIHGNEFVPNQEIVELTKLTGVHNLLTLDTKAIEEQLVAHPLIKSAYVSRKFPASLLIEISERKPIALLKGKNLIPIDEMGNLFENHSAEMLHDYPVVSNLLAKDSSEETNKRLQTVLTFLQDIKTHDFPLYSEVSEVSYSNRVGVYFLLTRGATVFWGDRNDSEKGRQLRLVMEKILAERTALSDVEYFDLRFENQVIVKQKERT